MFLQRVPDLCLNLHKPASRASSATSTMRPAITNGPGDKRGLPTGVTGPNNIITPWYHLTMCLCSCFNCSKIFSAAAILVLCSGTGICQNSLPNHGLESGLWNCKMRQKQTKNNDNSILKFDSLSETLLSFDLFSSCKFNCQVPDAKDSCQHLHAGKLQHSRCYID